MKNPQLMLKAQGRKFRLAVVGDTYQGPKRGFRFIPGQPRKGLTRKEALELAANWTQDRVITFAGEKVGSYVYPAIRHLLFPIGEEMNGGDTLKRPNESVAAPQKEAPKNVLNVTAEAADLIVQRRSALRAIAEIDAKLSGLIDDQAVEVIQRGMALPLAASAHH